MPPIYDSAASSPGGLGLAKEVWLQRRLVRLLVLRDLTLRYKRSILGAGWTLLNPLLEMIVLALVFSRVFRFSAPGVAYVVYLLSGIVIANMFRNAVIATAESLGANAGVLSRLRVPAAAFSTAAALQVFVTFLISLLPLIAIMIAVGQEIATTLPLAVVPAVLLVAFAFGIGLALAPLAVKFPDSVVLTGISLTLVTYLAPVFYPLSIVPHEYRFVVEANPLYHFLNAFRAAVYGDGLASVADYASMFGFTAVALVGGWLVFARTREGVLAQL
jgi:ABC-type polysaccharide/polyol phosphate export permease